ncbi:restriction endonuclease [Paenibacillus sp. GCM10023248]|uniref:restriction endonuclease n=1 Tax=unclassified Paenibacillus TaxID=185978 RepID=UPI002379C3EE|nr:restriction endonuclease [Paenibacillus sp. MAHUQ-63]MDD9267864.1 restriction endonuclease [Paenibacillus sp. MAHUQ-63]
MLNFKELAKDGNDLERLTREVFHREGFEVHWTGKGPDGGRDLIVIEKVQGPLSKFERKWLVQCKHNAHSGRSIGKEEANSLITDCERISADGYLLVCTTSLSSGLILAYEELKNSRKLKIDYWDEVKLEDRLFTPTNFQLINQFFPKSSEKVGWKIYNTNSPSFWAAHYKNSFIYLSARLNMHFPGLVIVEKIHKYAEDISRKFGVLARLRAVYFDDKNTNFCAYLDYLIDKKEEKEKRSPFQEDEIDEKYDQFESALPYIVEVEHGGVSLTWDVKGYYVDKNHDGYDPNGKEFYTPYIKKFQVGNSRE